MVTAVIVGAGHRALTYASYAQHHPEELQIVGVADPIAQRRALVAERYDLPAERCFASAEALAAQPQFADFVINGTMDHQHVATSLPLLAAGYDLLLEKPFATNEDELWQLVQTAQRYGSKVAICHVLRFAPFYRSIRQKVLDGVIGDLLNIQAVEHVSYHHMAVGFVRGKWNSKRKCFSPMLMAKCCHDLDLITWMKSGVAPVRVNSFGSNFQFRPERAPQEAGTRCLVDCPIEADCLYSARKHYLDHPDRWAFYVWDALQQEEKPANLPDKHYSELTLEEKRAWLQDDNPYGRCVWKCDNDVVDHQSVAIEFADGATATLNMIGGAAKPSRSLHLVGTRGEIQGNLEDSRFVIRHIDPRPGHEYAEEVIDLNASVNGSVNTGGDMTGAFGGHGGGDLRLIADFLQLVRGEQPSLSTTTLTDSVNGHLLGFCADQAMEEGRVISLPQKPEVVLPA